MLMTALLSLSTLQQPQILMPLEQSVLEQSANATIGLTVEEVIFIAPLSPSTQACGTANNSRKSCGGTGRRVLMS